ncbi:phosphoglycolate phosphatase [Arenibacterium sp. CAU 1754]
MSAAIVFDLDGTLIDSAPDIHAAVNKMLDEEGLAALDLATVTSFIGNGLPHLVMLTMQETGLDKGRHDALTQRVLAHYNADSSTLTRPYPGVHETLKFLLDAGHHLGLCTNKPVVPTRAILDDMAFDQFHAVIGGDSLPRRKPDPAPLHAAFEALTDGPRFYVGDSEVDAETADRAHVPFLLFTQGYRKTPVDALPHAATFDDFAVLPDLIAEMLK